MGWSMSGRWRRFLICESKVVWGFLMGRADDLLVVQVL